MNEVRALVFLGADKDPSLQIQTFPFPSVETGQILAKILLCTVCGSDVHTISGKRQEACPSILGHEAVAEVIECKRSDCKCNLGDRITFCIIDSCNTCTTCKTGYPQKCHSLAKYGHLPLRYKSGLTGCYATHIVLDKDTKTYVIPKNVPDYIVAPINCSLATMMNAVKNIPRSPHYNTAVVQGAGLLGLYTCLLLKEQLGFTHIICSDINKERLSLISKFGATQVVTSAKDLAKSSVDVVIEVCGNPTVIQEGLACLRPGGLYILVGMVHPDSQLNVTGEQVIRKCLTLIGVHNYKPKDLEDAVQFITKIHTKYPFKELISPEYSFDDTEKAIDCAREQKFLRVAIKPSM